MVRGLLNKVKLLFIGGKERRIAQRFVRSIEERSWNENLMRRISSVHLRSNATLEEYNFLGDVPNWIRRRKAFDSQYVYTLSGAIVGSHTGVVWFEDGTIFGESFGSLNRLLANKKFQTEYFSSPDVVDSEVIPLPHVGGFFHFMFEVLPAAIASLQLYPGARLLIPENPPRYMLAYASLLTNSQPLICSGPVRMRKIIFAGRTPYSGFIPKVEIERIHNFFLNKFPREIPEMRIYISRANDKRRFIENEIDLERGLIKLGYASFILQQMSVSEQIRLFRKARTVIAPHGAGLSNVIWCGADTKVIEIFPFKPRNDCYSRLCAILGLDYQFFVCEESKTSSGVIPIEEVLSAAATI